MSTIASSRPAHQSNSAIRVIKYALFSASIVPSFVGAAFAYYLSPAEFSLINAILAGLGLFLGQSAGDYFYFYGTNFHSNGQDAHTKIFAGWKPLLTDSFLGDRGTLWAGVFCLAIDLVIAIYFTYAIGTEIIVLAGLGALVAIFFTPLMLKGYKEIVIFFTFGPLVLVGLVYALTTSYDHLADAVLLSLPLGFLITVVAYLKGARYEVSTENDKTLVLKLNKKVITVLTIGAYVGMAVLFIVGILPLWGLLAFAALPVSISVLKVIDQSKSEINAYLWAVVRAISALVLTGIVFTLVFTLNP